MNNINRIKYLIRILGYQFHQFGTGEKNNPIKLTEKNKKLWKQELGI